AYRELSDRIGIPEITRMTTLLTQNLKKGSTSLVVLLSQEASKAFEGRRQRARIKGEEAQTKLLAPMTLLMIVVLVIIMIPAFWGM
ncbi:MAG: type II secretion system F family protein, partial [Lachnospiraceae bacterium]|nr:type II secretion system F family protein [Lachnospiraceae bacterium]